MKILTKWISCKNHVVVYRLDDKLIWYKENNDPNYSEGKQVSIEEIMKTNYYKIRPFSLEEITNDLAVRLPIQYSIWKRQPNLFGCLIKNI